jgi:hypothetical protein
LSQRIFRDRREAGRLLAKELAAFANRPDVIVLALPRGGVPGLRWLARSVRRWTYLSCASWACPGTRSWRWAPSRAAVCACSMTAS